MNQMYSPDGVFFYNKNTNEVILQSRAYIEHGWYIVINHQCNSLYDIPEGGGEPILIGDYIQLLDALKHAYNLT